MKSFIFTALLLATSFAFADDHMEATSENLPMSNVETSAEVSPSSHIPFLDNISTNVAVTSDYIWRGTSQNSKKAAVQGGLDYEHSSGLALGIWGSNVDGGTEIDFYSSYTVKVSDDFSISPGITLYHYIYPEKGANADTFEFNLVAELFATDLSVNYGEDYFNFDSSYLYFSLARSYEIANELNIGFTLGYNLFDDEVKVGTDSYFHYILSVTKAYKDLEIGVHYADSVDKDYDPGENTDRNLYFTLSYSL